jgi:uncharacterized protein YecT (DUF1311 family)
VTVHHRKYDPTVNYYEILDVSYTATGTEITRAYRDLMRHAHPDRFAGERERLGAALEQAQQHLGVLLQHAMASLDESKRTEIHKAGLHSTDLLYSLAEVTIAWLLIRQADVAQAALDAGATGSDADFYRGKLASARWFARSALPKVALRTARAVEEDGALMQLPDAAF